VVLSAAVRVQLGQRIVGGSLAAATSGTSAASGCARKELKCVACARPAVRKELKIWRRLCAARPSVVAGAARTKSTKHTTKSEAVLE
jgi:ribosomal protein L37AE/L43A